MCLFRQTNVEIFFGYGHLWLVLMVASSANLIVRWVPLVWTSQSYTNTWSGCQPLNWTSWGFKRHRKDLLCKVWFSSFLTMQPFDYTTCLVDAAGLGLAEIHLLLPSWSLGTLFQYYAGPTIIWMICLWPHVLIHMLLPLQDCFCYLFLMDQHYSRI